MDKKQRHKKLNKNRIHKLIHITLKMRNNAKQLREIEDKNLINDKETNLNDWIDEKGE